MLQTEELTNAMGGTLRVGPHSRGAPLLAGAVGLSLATL